MINTANSQYNILSLGVQTLVQISQHRTESIHCVGVEGKDGGHGRRGGDCKASCGRGYLHGELK